MPRFAANLSMLFTEVPFLERFDRAARAGFGSVEFLFPYAHTPGEVAAKLKGNRLSLVLHNLPAGDWDAGERGIACLPDRVDEFRAGVAKAIRDLGPGPQRDRLLTGVRDNLTSRSDWERLLRQHHLRVTRTKE